MKINTQLNISFAVVLFVPMICAAVFSVVYFSQKITEAAVSKIHSDSKAADIIFHDSLTEMKHLATAYAQKKTVIMLINFNLGEKSQQEKDSSIPCCRTNYMAGSHPGTYL